MRDMAVQRQIVTAEDFDAYIQRDDLGDQIVEFIGGEIVEVPGNPYVSSIAAKIIYLFLSYLAEHPIGWVTGEAGLYMVTGERYATDVAYISKALQPELAREGANPNPPELVVEVVSDEASARELETLMLKVSNYIAAGAVVWVVYPTAQLIRVHVPGQPVQIVSKDGTLDGGDVLPGFTLAVSEIFETA
jgi:Uma2 family endonuclease